MPSCKKQTRDWSRQAPEPAAMLEVRDPEIELSNTVGGSVGPKIEKKNTNNNNNNNKCA